MDLMSVGKLLGTICIHYPAFKNHCMTEDNKINRLVAQEWYRLIGYMDYEEALTKFDQYLKLPEGNKFAPDVKWFLSSKSDKKEREYFHHRTHHQWHLEFMKSDKEHRHGRLYDEEGREYIVDPLNEDGFYYDGMGRICQSGKVVFP